MPDSRFPFSNFQPAKVVYEGVLYPTVEHAYQASKSDNASYRLRVLHAYTPGQAKRLGNAARLRPDWERVKRQIMLDLLRQKYAAGTDFARDLAMFQDRIVEWNTWHDNYWGICTCPRCPSRGKNYLGKLLKHVRQELIDSVPNLAEIARR